jgi:hypothetical protein
MGERMTEDLVLDALTASYWRRKQYSEPTYWSGLPILQP